MPEEHDLFGKICDVLDKTIIYTTGALFIDVVVGQAFVGRPLHELSGFKFPDYLQTAENTFLAIGATYVLYRLAKDE